MIIVATPRNIEDYNLKAAVKAKQGFPSKETPKKIQNLKTSNRICDESVFSRHLTIFFKKQIL